MRKKQPQPTTRPRERAILIGAEIRGQNNLLSLEDSLNELALLAETAGLDVIGQVTQRLDRPNPQTYIGPGKAEEVRLLAEETGAEVLLFDEELSPRHLREFEKILGEEIRVLDRTALILDIFAQHAGTREGALQVELAQYEYRLPRLTFRQCWRGWITWSRRDAVGGRPARYPPAHHPSKGRIGESAYPPPAIPGAPETCAHPGRRLGGLHQRRKIDIAQPAVGCESFCR